MYGHAELTHAKAEMDRLRTRLRNKAKENEEMIDVGLATIGVVGGMLGWGYVNERHGEAPKDDPNGPKELKMLGAPLDLAVGVVAGGFAAFGALGKYSGAGFNIAQTSIGSFAGRLGQEFGKRALEKHGQGGGQKTAGARTTGQGRSHQVDYQT